MVHVILIGYLLLLDYLNIGTSLLSEVTLRKAYDKLTVYVVSHLYSFHFPLGYGISCKYLPTTNKISIAVTAKNYKVDSVQLQIQIVTQS